MGISEIRRAGEAIEERTGYIMYNKGETEGLKGLGFMVKSYLRNSILNFVRVND